MTTLAIDPGAMSGYAVARGSRLLVFGQTAPSAVGIQRALVRVSRALDGSPPKQVSIERAAPLGRIDERDDDGRKRGGAVMGVLSVHRAIGRWELALEQWEWARWGKKIGGVYPQTWHAWLRRQGYCKRTYGDWKAASRAFAAARSGRKRELLKKEHNAADAACQALYFESLLSDGDLFEWPKRKTESKSAE